jgi:hypothetical protein
MTVTLYARRALGIAAPWRGAALGGPAVRVVPPFSRRLVGLLITPSRPQGVRAVSGPDVKKADKDGCLLTQRRQAATQGQPCPSLACYLPFSSTAAPNGVGGRQPRVSDDAWCAPAATAAVLLAAFRPCRHPTPATLDASVSPPCSTHSERMLKRKPTRIELKPEDREEYFAHKKETAKPPSEVESAKPSEKEVRIGLAKAR